MTVDEALSGTDAREADLTEFREMLGDVYAPAILAAEVRRLRAVILAAEVRHLRDVISRALDCIEQAGPDQDEFGGPGPVSSAERILRGEP